MSFKRVLDLSDFDGYNFFLWGPRKSGKSTLLKAFYGDSMVYIDLLKTDEALRYAQDPSYLRRIAEASAEEKRIVIDEVQKVPALLDEVHWLIENKAKVFTLCGSSARKLKRGKANLLGGRALKAELFGLVWPEIKQRFDLSKLLTFGYLPQHYEDKKAAQFIRSYVGDYIKEEIMAEGLVRNLPAFSGFLELAAFSEGSPVNFNKIASEMGVSGHTVKEYYTILCDTLMGVWVPAYTKRAKRQPVKSPKFYFTDIGVVNHLSKVSSLDEKTSQYGRAFENFIRHELYCCSSYKELHYDIRYWQLARSAEVDFIVGDMEVAIEVKSTTKIQPRHYKSLRSLSVDYVTRRRIIVCREPHKVVSDDGIEVYPYELFLEELWAGEILS